MSLVFLGDTKRCSKCKKYKPFSEYHMSKTGPRGIVSVCKDCRNTSKRKYKSREDRFWKHFHSHTVKDGDCLIWTGAKVGTGMPSCRWNGGMGISVRRVVYKLSCGELTDDEVVLMTCNNKLCVRQNHMKKGSLIDRNVKAHNAARSVIGSRNGFSKLTETNIRIIRDRAALGESQRSIAQDFGVATNTINYCVNGRTWKHVQ